MHTVSGSWGLRFWVLGSGFRGLGFGGLGFLGFRVLGLWGLGFGPAGFWKGRSSHAHMQPTQALLPLACLHPDARLKD